MNGNPDVKTVDPDRRLDKPVVPHFDHLSEYPKGTKDRLTDLGPEAFCQWLKTEKRVYYTDTSFRDAHQSLLATAAGTLVNTDDLVLEVGDAAI